jgi:Ni,Fe-hydrogenase III small subunit
MVLIYAYDINVLGASIHATQKNTETLVVTGKETGPEVKAVKTKCMAMSQEQQAGQNHNIQKVIKSSKRVENFKYLGTALTNRNYIHE